MALSELQLNKCREILHWRKAFLLERQESVFIPMAEEGELLVAWPEGNLDMGAACVEFLENFTWVTNTEPRRYVDAPQIGKEIFHGRYRQAFVRRITVNKEPLILLVLREGYLTDVVRNGQINWDEARNEQRKEAPPGALTDVDGGNTASDFLTIKWQAIDPRRSEACKQQLIAANADTFQPVVRGETFGANWHRLFVQDRP